MRKRFVFIFFVAIIGIYVNVSAQITTTEPPPCEVTINPNYAIVYIAETQQFSASEWGACNTPCYTWEISMQGSTGSSINANGVYTAGGPGTDMVTVTDNCNGNISDTGAVHVTTPNDTTTIPNTTTIPGAPVAIDIGNGSGFPGTTNNAIIVSLDNPNDKIAGLQVDICDVDDYLTCTGCETTGRTVGFDCVIGDNDVTNNCCRVILVCKAPGCNIEEGSGSVATIEYDVLAEAPAGECRDLNPEGAVVSDENGYSLGVETLPGQFCFASAPAPESPTSIPTLSEWGIIIFLTIVMGIGVMILLRRKVA